MRVLGLESGTFRVPSSSRAATFPNGENLRYSLSMIVTALISQVKTLSVADRIDLIGAFGRSCLLASVSTGLRERNNRAGRSFGGHGARSRRPEPLVPSSRASSTAIALASPCMSVGLPSLMWRRRAPSSLPRKDHRALTISSKTLRSRAGAAAPYYRAAAGLAWRAPARAAVGCLAPRPFGPHREPARIGRG